MDPQANIERQRELAADLIAPTWDLDELAAKASELAELVQALDEWRSMGGYDPYMKERRWADPSYRRGPRGARGRLA